MPSQQDLTLATLFKAVEDGSFKRVVRRLTMLLNGLNNALGQTNKAAERVEKATKKAAAALDKAGKQAGKTKKDVDNLTGAVNQVARSFKVAARYFIAYRLFHAITAGAKEGIAEIVNFDQALHNLAAISGATSGELDQMKGIILETADRTKYSTTEIAEGMVLLTQAGLSAAEATNAIGAVADLAAGTLSNLATTSDLVTTALRAFNINAIETRRVADIMANAVNKSKLTIDKLRISFNYIGAGAHQAGLSLEQTAGSMMLMANAGARASTIGTGMRQVLSRLLSPNQKLQQAMASYGLEIDKNSGKSGWFKEQLIKLSSVMYNFETNTVDMSKAYELFGLRGAQAAAILISSLMDLNGTWAETMDLTHRVGTAQKMMEEQAKGLAFKIKNLSDKLKNLAIIMGDAGFTATLKGAVDTLRQLVTWFTEFAGHPIGQFIINVVGATATVLALVGSFKVLLLLLPSLKVIGTFLISPLGLVATAIGVAIGAIVAFNNHLKKMAIEGAKTANAQKAILASFSNYKKELEDAEVGSEKYLNIVERLKIAHPELKREIDRVKGSYEELNKVIERNIELARQKQFEGDIQQLAELSRAITMARDDYEYFSKASTSFKEKFPTFEDYTEEVKGFTVQFGNLRDVFDQMPSTISNLAKRFKDLKGVNIGEEIRKAVLAGGFKFDEAELQYLVNQVKKRIDEIKNYAIQAEKDRQRAMKERVDALPKEWRRVYNTLSTLEKTRFFEALERADKEYAARKKSAETFLKAEGKSKKEVEKEVAKLKNAIYDENLSKFRQTIEKERDLITSLPTEWKKVYDELSEYQKYEMIKEYNSRVTGFKKIAKEIRKIVKSEGASALEIEKRVNEAKAEYLKQGLEQFERNEDAKAYKAEKILQQINEKSARYTGDKYAAEAAKAETFYKKMEQQIDLLIVTEKEKDAIRLRNKEVYYERLERMARIHGFGSEEERKGFEETTGVTTDETYGVTSAEKLSRMWKESGENMSVYIAQLKILRNEGKITAEEHERALERTFSKPGEAFANGWEKAMEKVRNASEFLYDLGEQLPEKLADGFTDAWEEFLDGTKSASEAFEDFARDVLKWIARMITKWLVMKAIQGVTGAVTGTTAHKGGIIGKDTFPKKAISSALFSFAPRLHDGINNKLKKNEYPAILERDEGVFTKGQMKALGAAGGTSINVPVNIGDSEKGDILKRHLPQAIEEAVLKTMRRYIR